MYNNIRLCIKCKFKIKKKQTKINKNENLFAHVIIIQIKYFKIKL